jgi:membrane-bound serine protease (ClpP class)
MDWWQQASHVIVLPWVTIALLVAGCLLLFHDLLTPLTWGVTGTLGVICLGAVFAAQIATGSAGWIGIILLLGGLALLLIETHLLPGHGMPAAFGLILLFAGMFLALGGNERAGFALGVSTVLTVTAVFAFFAYLPKSPVWKKLGQEMQQRSELGYRSSESQMYLLGRSGVAVTVLRPSGIAQIDGQRVDVVTEGDFLDAGVPVVVTEVEGIRVVVERRSEEQRSVSVG